MSTKATIEKDKIDFIRALMDGKCPLCGGEVEWYRSGWGVAWYAAEYGRCRSGCASKDLPAGRGVIIPPHPEDIIKLLLSIVEKV